MSHESISPSQVYKCKNDESECEYGTYSRSSTAGAAAEAEADADGLELVPALEPARANGGEDEYEREGARDDGDDADDTDADADDADEVVVDADSGGCSDMAARYCSRNSTALMRGVYPVRFICTTCAVTAFFGFSERASLRFNVPMTGRAEPNRAEADEDEDEDEDRDDELPREDGGVAADREGGGDLVEEGADEDEDEDEDEAWSWAACRRGRDDAIESGAAAGNTEVGEEESDADSLYVDMAAAAAARAAAETRFFEVDICGV